MAAPVRAFLSYAHEDHAWRDVVLEHLGWLRQRGRLDLFDDRQIEPGTQWDPRIKAALEAADIIVLLLSPHFLNSRYCLVDELVRALERQVEGTVELFPIVCDHVARWGADRQASVPAAGCQQRSVAPGRLAQSEPAPGGDCREDQPDRRPDRARSEAYVDDARRPTCTAGDQWALAVAGAPRTLPRAWRERRPTGRRAARRSTATDSGARRRGDRQEHARPGGGLPSRRRRSVRPAPGLGGAGQGERSRRAGRSSARCLGIAGGSRPLAGHRGP